MNVKKLLLPLVACALIVSTRADQLESNFSHPPETTKPRG